MLKLVSERTESDGLSLCLRLIGRSTISKPARILNHFRNPLTIFFLVDFNRKNPENLDAAILPFRHAHHKRSRICRERPHNAPVQRRRVAPSAATVLGGEQREGDRTRRRRPVLDQLGYDRVSARQVDPRGLHPSP